MAYGNDAVAVGTTSNRLGHVGHDARVCPTPNVPQSDLLLSDLNNRLNDLEKLSDELQAVATRLCGSVLKGEAKTPGTPPHPESPSLLQKLEYAVQYAEQLRIQIAATLSRLQAAV